MNPPAHVVNSIRKSRYLAHDLPSNINTVCEEAKCPNRGECFSKKTVTFLLLGSNCTRHCSFCGISHFPPSSYDFSAEISSILVTIEKFQIKYVVLTSVTRDDLSDGGASVFAQALLSIRSQFPDVRVEVLTPDFQGNLASIDRICHQHPYVFNHNLEMVPRLFKEIRPEGNFKLSFNLLSYVQQRWPDIKVKTGIMVGLGETAQEVFSLIELLGKTRLSILTIGQYLQPKKTLHKVARYVDPSEFNDYIAYGKKRGLTIFAGPLVRSSYMAEQVSQLQ